ncbi:hypothetical protein [Helicobacter sp.]|uniref:hypothetical protein n=1 Tax=Helicobacter sp. TaxID=218 RepID=UPI0025C29480|nr:hypothetical protein [Helicobacter sp.]MCI5968293.1 hypothetical protein [Helicobacter sp.]MDY2585385.1 hypothetical protein [Helicobacter sp.]
MSLFDYSHCDFKHIKKHKGIVYLDTQGYKKPYGDYFEEGLIFSKDAYEEFLKEENVFTSYKIIIFPTDIDQILLFENKNQIKNFLTNGGILLNFAPTYLQYLPKLPLYTASKTPIKLRDIEPLEHCITRGVKSYDISYRRGVKGFFSRGFIDCPKNAEIFLKDSDGRCVAYVDNTQGLLIHTAGADLLGFGFFENSTAKRLAFNLLLWLEGHLKEIG